MSYTLAPYESRQYFDANGDPLDGGLVYTYLAGTSTPATTYSTSTGTPNANPVLMDSSGRCSIYLDALSYKFIVKDSAGNIIWTQDNIQSTQVSPGSAVASTTTLTGTQTSLPIPSGLGDLVIYAANASLLTVAGIAPGLDGQQLTIISKGAGIVAFTSLGSTTSAALQIVNFVSRVDVNTFLAAGVGSAIFVYDTTSAKWRMTAHEQGAPISPVFSGTDWSATGGSWTVASGDVLYDNYYLRGRQLTICIGVQTTTVATTPSALGRTLYGYTAMNTTGIGRTDTVAWASDNGAALAVMQAKVINGATAILFILPGGNWSNATDATTVLCQHIAEVS